MLNGRKRERGFGERENGRKGEREITCLSHPLSLSPFPPLPTLLLAALLALSACSSITSEEPPIADSTMVEILIELHLADARLDLQLDRIPAIRDSILFKHGLDEPRFLQILDYYAEHPEEYTALYTTVLDRLSDERLRQGEGLPLSNTPPPGVADEQDN